MKAFFYVGVMLPMWTSYLVKVYAWRLILAKQGSSPGASTPSVPRPCSTARCETPVIGGPSLASSYIGMFIVFVYMWLPFMILRSRQRSSACRARCCRPRRTSAHGPARPSATWCCRSPCPASPRGRCSPSSLTLGDYIIPSVVGAPGYFIGMMVYQQQGTAGNMPLAAAFSVVPIVLIALYLTLARRLGAFDAL